MKKPLVLLFLLFISTSAFAETCFKSEAQRQVVILPPTGGSNVADRALYRSLCNKGHQVTILDYTQKSGLTVDLSIHDRLSQEALGEIDRFLAESQKPTVLIGASLGGLYASMAFGYSLTGQTEFNSLGWIEGLVLVVSGGPLPEILSYSDQDEVKEQRALRLRELGIINIGDYQRELEKAIFYDPLKWATPAARNQVLMFNSRNDDIVPSQTQEALWRAWGEPQLEKLSTSHALSIARVYFFMADRIDKFLRGQ